MAKQSKAIILLTGDVHSADFPDWIARHACKLGLSAVGCHAAPDGLEVTAQGDEEMLQALALAASLGPQTVLVETVKIKTEGVS